MRLRAGYRLNGTPLPEDSVTMLCLLVMSGNAWSPLETKRRAMRH